MGSPECANPDDASAPAAAVDMVQLLGDSAPVVGVDPGVVDKGSGKGCGLDSAGSRGCSNKAKNNAPGLPSDPDFLPFGNDSSPRRSPVLGGSPALVPAAVGHVRADGRGGASREAGVTSPGTALAPGEPARRAKICPLPSITQPCQEGFPDISPYRRYVENPSRTRELRQE